MWACLCEYSHTYVHTYACDLRLVARYFYSFFFLQNIILSKAKLLTKVNYQLLLSTRFMHHFWRYCCCVISTYGWWVWCDLTWCVASLWRGFWRLVAAGLIPHMTTCNIWNICMCITTTITIIISIKPISSLFRIEFSLSAMQVRGAWAVVACYKCNV